MDGQRKIKSETYHAKETLESLFPGSPYEPIVFFHLGSELFEVPNRKTIELSIHSNNRIYYATNQSAEISQDLGPNPNRIQETGVLGFGYYFETRPLLQP